ncbi:MAG: hypothetical protein ACRD8U_10590 [Pyrinomonadaceae bacterium]
MKYTKPLLIALVTFNFGLLSASIWFGSLGKRRWSSRVFAWPNPLRQPPKIDLRPDSPLLISNARYYSFMSIGSAVGGNCVLMSPIEATNLFIRMTVAITLLFEGATALMVASLTAVYCQDNRGSTR